MAGMLAVAVLSGFWEGPKDFVGFGFSAFAMVMAGFLASGLGLRRELDRREQAL